MIVDLFYIALSDVFVVKDETKTPILKSSSGLALNKPPFTQVGKASKGVFCL